MRGSIIGTSHKKKGVFIGNTVRTIHFDWQVIHLRRKLIKC